MVHHFKILEHKTVSFIENVCFYFTEVEWRDPVLVLNQNHVNDACLNVANDAEQEDDIKAFELVLYLTRLVEAGD